MDQYTGKMLDITNESEIIAYEEATYKAFVQNDDPTLALTWDFDHKLKRIRSKIPYEHQIVYLVKEHSQITAAVAIHTGGFRPRQLELIGFDVPWDSTCAEVILVFNHPRGNALLRFDYLMNQFAFKSLKEQLITKLYASGSRRIASAFTFFGFKTSGEIVSGKHVEYLMVYTKDTGGEPLAEAVELSHEVIPSITDRNGIGEA